MKMKYTEQAVETLDDAGSVIANKNIEIEQLHQRVAELETQLAKNNPLLDEAADALDKLTAERDKATQYWNIAEGRCDALIKQRDELLKACETYMSHGICEVTYYAIRNAIASVKEKS